MIFKLFYNGILILAIILLSNFLVKFLHRWIDKTSNRYGKLDKTIVPILYTVSTVTVYAVGLVIILDCLGVNTASILAIFGTAGLAVALALKDTLSNIAAGMMLLLLRPFRVGHAIEFGSIVGTVKEVGLFTTILETPDGLYISSPNSRVWGTPIKNFTRNGKRRMDLIVGISYSDSIDTGFEVFKSIIQSEPRFLSAPPPQMMVESMADSAVNLQLRAWTMVENYWDVYWDANKKIKEQIEAAGLTIPFPQREVHVVNEK